MKQRILQLLRNNQGRPVSGEEISSWLGVSRTAVWKHMQALRREGHQIESRQKVGYILLESPDRLYPQEISDSLPNKALAANIHYYPEVDSTNNVAKRSADQGAPHGTLVLAEQQTAGRGRRGKEWLSANQKGLWFSVVLRPGFSPLFAPKLTFVAAVAVAKGIAQSTGVKIQLKWPNDIYYEGKKLAGILTEMKAELDLVEYVVMGIGININQSTEDMPVEIAQLASSLCIVTGSQVNRQKCLIAILEQLELWYTVYLNQGFAPILEEWKNWDVTVGSLVKVIGATEEYQGRAIAVDQEGTLLVQDTQGTIRSVISGEVSIKLS